MIIAMSANSCWYLYNFRKNTISALISSGAKVICIAPNDRYADDLIKLGCIHHPISMTADSTNLWRELKALRDLYVLLNRIRPAILLTFNPKLNIYGGISARSLKIRHIANISGLGALNDGGSIMRFAYMTLYRIALHSTEHIFFQNNRDKDLLCNLKVVRPSKTSRLMGSGVDLQRFGYKPMPPSPPTRFVFIGRLIEQKGVRAFVQAAQRLQEKFSSTVQFSIIGMIENSASKRAITRDDLYIWEREHNIRFRGATDDVANAVAEDHVVVLPTIYSEGVPKVALESSAVGRIVITSDLPGCRDTVEDGLTGFICDPENIASIVGAMELAVGLGESAKTQMGQAARLRMRELFDEKDNINEYLKRIRL